MTSPHTFANHTVDAAKATELTVGQATVRYRTRGFGPGLVLVHGGGRGSVTWDGLLDRFTDRYTVVLPDLAGSDPARDDGAPLTVEALTEQLAAVIEDTGLGRVDVVGHSLGAVAALSLAVTRPDLVRRLVPLAGYSHCGDEYLRNTLELLLALADRSEAFARYAMLTAFSRRYLNSIGRPAVEELARSLAPTPDRIRQFDLARRVDIHGLLPLIEAPTLVIGCADDSLAPVENARGIHAAVPGSEYAELECGHVARVERPEELVALIRGFLDRPAVEALR
ncbi:alpha/beta hydrolase [Streptomyces sp. ME19-01-6]|uniref:alpha/beta fold hydrolase n=1 Tax=Streptomyces sp. ME19-01-6 TaxID=3028686 RepID=UPI0029A9B9DA|nr:alpha/beta hydrolase [Streptomyces sp. ME19-01-6]MDX3224355.1 alpha/beta hydrolase [Streptomyces sp. ME19-01-6]